jgi:hypothetical protein
VLAWAAASGVVSLVRAVRRPRGGRPYDVDGTAYEVEVLP